MGLFLSLSRRRSMVVWLHTETSRPANSDWPSGLHLKAYPWNQSLQRLFIIVTSFNVKSVVLLTTREINCLYYSLRVSVFPGAKRFPL